MIFKTKENGSCHIDRYNICRRPGICAPYDSQNAEMDAAPDELAQKRTYIFRGMSALASTKNFALIYGGEHVVRRAENTGQTACPVHTRHLEFIFRVTCSIPAFFSPSINDLAMLL